MIERFNEIFKEHNAKKAQGASKEVKKLHKMINNNLNMSSAKSEIINRLIKLYRLKRLYYLNKIHDNSEANENIDDILIDNGIIELEKRLRDLNYPSGRIKTNKARPFKDQKVSGMFTLQKEFAKLLIFLSQLHAGNNSKKLKNDINQLLKALYESKQISKLVYNNMIKAITYKNDS